jgi:putative ABC transport system permease protein
VLHMIAVDLRRHRARTALTASGIAVGVAAIVALLAVSSGIERSAAGLINLGHAEIGMFQAGVGDLTASKLPSALVARADKQKGVAQAAGIAVATGQLPQAGSFLVFGLEPRSFIMDRLVFLEGRPLRSAREAVLGEAAARQLGLGAGDTLAIAGGTFRIAGVYHAGVPFEDQGAALPLAAVQKMRGLGGDLTLIAISIARGARAADVGARLEHAFPGTVAISQPGQVARLDTNSLLIRKGGLVFGVLAMIIGGIAVANTMLMAVFERQREFALLLAVGWPRRLVGSLVLREGLLLSLGGALAGLALGVLAADLIVHAVAAATLIAPHVTVWTLARALLIAAATGALGSLYPAWRVSRLRPVEALE